MASYGLTDNPDRCAELESLESRLSISGRELACVRVGPPSGAKVLFLPGLGSTWRCWLGSLKRLSSEFDCFAVDLPGFGRSERPRLGLDVRFVSQVLAELVNVQAGEPVWVVAHSLGGLVAVDLRRRYSDLVHGMILVNAVFPDFLRVFQQPARLIMRPGQNGVAALALLASCLPLRRSLATLLRRSVTARRLILRPFVERPDLISPTAAASLAVGGSPGSVIGVLRNGFENDYLAALSSLRETLIIHGANDRLSTGADIEMTLAISPDVDVVEISGSRHVAMLEYPSTVDNLMSDWLLARSSR